MVGEFGGAPAAGGKKKRTAEKGGASRKKSSARAEEQETVQLDAAGERLAARLRDWRKAEASKRGWPPYLILLDRTLELIAAHCPRTPNELLAISGVGQAKLDRFGEAILELTSC